ncbi:serine/threonine-protein kinase [Dictyobacter formicarum]|uniref:non-specific serine/threonine protein kinase n=1 Tax=Dictyobacter formicarum TaxID=2778368 RepID=A0ABQ3VH07_9CHLR|nr:serine/threonine-protein kinase [Dictyobacter formicarum]GHO84984.1 hypothetical protein KSZ_29900 [Dictyobacter formicarum]
MADRIGQRLGNYTIVQLLGQGGFAEVYLGEHLYLKSQAAIKILQARLSGSDDTDSFLKEAQTIARLSHPNIVRVLDFGIDGETPYLVMDYAPNGTLRQRHARGVALPLTTIIPYVTQVADALQYAHDEHIIHRDVKPENMLLGRRNEVLLSDFGIALVAQSSRYQGTQDVIGTVAYMSPEQIQGKPRPASDQYSLAVVAYEWLTGDRPFRGSFTEMCTQHMFAAPPPLREKLGQVSPEVERVVMQALDKDPKKRFENIKAFASALSQAGQSYQTELMSGSGTSSPYSTVAMQSDTNVPPQTPNISGVSPAPFTAMASQPFNPSSGSQPNLTHGAQQMGTQQNNRPAPTGQESTSNQSGNQGQAPTMHSSLTEAQTNRQAQHNPNSAYPQQQQQPGQQKMVLPATNTPQGGPNNGPRPPFQSNPQQYQQQRPPQQPYPPMQRPQQQQPYHPGYNNGQQQGYQQHNGPQPYRPEPPAQQQQHRPQSSYSGASHHDYDEPDERSHADMPRESLEDWLGPLNAWKWPLLATVVGIILFCFLHSFKPIIYGRSIPILLVLPLFFGAAFGPIVGILVGAGGAMIADFMYRGNDTLTATLFHNANFGPQYHAWWFPVAFYGITGLLTGLTMLRRRKFPSIGSSIRASLLAVIGLAAVISFILYNAKEWRLFPEIGLIVLINIAISLIILVVYSIMGRLIDPA